MTVLKTIVYHADSVVDDYIFCLLNYTAPDVFEARELIYRWACVNRLRPAFLFNSEQERELRLTSPDLLKDGSMGETLTQIEREFGERLPAYVTLALDTEGFQTWHEDLVQLANLVDDEELCRAQLVDMFEDFDMSECVLWAARELGIDPERVRPFEGEVQRMRQAFGANLASFCEAGNLAYLTLRCADHNTQYGGTLAKHRLLCQYVNRQCVDQGMDPPYPEYGTLPERATPQDVEEIIRAASDTRK